jgi:hypothetical protein
MVSDNDEIDTALKPYLLTMNFSKSEIHMNANHILSDEARIYFEDKGFKTTVSITDQLDIFRYLGARLKVIGKIYQ